MYLDGNLYVVLICILFVTASNSALMSIQPPVQYTPKEENRLGIKLVSK
jgi:hypothetical protein